MMSSHPPSPGDDTAPATYNAAGPMALGPPFRWYHKLSAILLVAFCFEIGIFLVIFPWTPYWDANYFAGLPWHRFWGNLYFRGAVSGLGVVNLYIAVLELYRLRRFARR